MTDPDTKGASQTPDLIFGHTQATYKSAVNVEMQHALAAIKVIYDGEKMLTAHKVNKILVKGMFTSGKCSYEKDADDTEGGYKFVWSEQDGSQDLTEEVNVDVYGRNGQLGGKSATFMVIPGAKLNVSVWIDDSTEPYVLNLAEDVLLQAGKTYVVKIGDDYTLKETGGVVVAKDVLSFDEGDDTVYTITMQAYVTGEKIHVETVKPVDIAVLVDLSGSMNESFDAVTYNALAETSYSWTSLSGANKYYKDGSNYYQVHKSSYYSNYCYLYYTANGTDYYLTSSGVTTTKPTNITDTSATIWTGVLYTQAGRTSTTKIEATQDAIKAFIANVLDNAKEKNVTHRISLVKFASQYFYGGTTEGAGDVTHIGNDFIKSSGYNYCEIMTDWKELSNDKDESSALTAAVNSMDPAGATSADYGMMCVNQIFKSARSDAKKVVVMLTDGEPNHKNGFNASVATATVKQASYLKNDGATVWSIFVGVLPTDNASKIKSYMAHVSSIYKQENSEAVTSYTDGTKVVDPSTKEDGSESYYRNATDTEALNDIFEAISEESGGADTELMDQTILQDKVASVFDLPEGIKTTMIHCYTSAYLGQDAEGNIVWDDRLEVTDDVDISINGNQLQVTGFSYSDNWCGPGHEYTEGATEYGKKLIVVLTDLKLKPGVDVSKAFTNVSGSGLWLNDVLMVEFPTPEIDVSEAYEHKTTFKYTIPLQKTSGSFVRK